MNPRWYAVAWLLAAVLLYVSVEFLAWVVRTR